MHSQSHKVTRRTLLHGVGVTMALPWLESLPVWGAETPVAAPPLRMAALFMGNGISPNNWWAKGAGADMELSKSLEPLESLRSRLKSSPGCSTSPPRASASIPADRQHPLRRGAAKRAVLHGGVSVDQVLAAHFGEETAQPSLVLGCEQPITGYHETNFSMAYSSHISWQDANSPVPMEVYPSLAFDSLFDNQGSRRTQSILDRVKEQAAAPQPPGQFHRQGQARRIPDQRTRDGKARRAHPPDKGQGRRPSRNRGRPASRCPGPTTACPKTSASTCG